MAFRKTALDEADNLEFLSATLFFSRSQICPHSPTRIPSTGQGLGSDDLPPCLIRAEKDPCPFRHRQGFVLNYEEGFQVSSHKF
jgi:hypothetical protein